MLRLVSSPQKDTCLSNRDVGIKTTELDNLLAETSAYLNILHPDFGKLAARVSVTKLHKETSSNFLEVISTLYHYTETDRKQNFPSWPI